MKITVLALAAALSLALVGSASAATASVDIRENAVVIEGGRAVLVFVEVECALDPGETLLEGNLSVSQDDAFGMAGLNPVCNGRKRVYPIRVTTFDGTFEAGEAFASAFLLFLNPETQETTSAGDFTVITIRGVPA
jgi:hypothetical protein